MRVQAAVGRAGRGGLMEIQVLAAGAWEWQQNNSWCLPRWCHTRLGPSFAASVCRRKIHFHIHPPPPPFLPGGAQQGSQRAAGFWCPAVQHQRGGEACREILRKHGLITIQ